MERVLPPELAPEIAHTVPQIRDLADFEAVVRLYRPAIFRFLAASVRDPQAAENMTQDCLLRAYRSRDGFRGAASVKTWLMQIAVNLLRNELKNARLRFWKRTQRSSVDVSSAGEWLADRRSSPEAAALARQQVAAVWAAVEGLPERQRTVFLLRFVEEMDSLEIAAVTGMKEGTVKTHLFRALQTVRQRIEERK
jgi:RNA polymerase sigma-70 factor (ECF subfamily)